MSIDHCIITKYDLSERERQIKRAFFNKSLQEKGLKDDNSKKPDSIKNPQFSHLNDEMINKLIDENFKTKSAVMQNNKYSDNINNSMPLNLVYSQNKILERNVDVLQETQRSLHDLLVYNLKNKGNNTQKRTNNNIDKEVLSQLIQPLQTSINDLKYSINNIVQSKNILTNQSNIGGEQSLNDKVKDMVSKHNEFKENSHKIQKSIDQVEKNKQMSKDNTILKAIEDLKNSVSSINIEMNKMENEFDNKFKRILEENEKKNVLNMINGVSNSINATNNKVRNYSQKKNGLDELDYIEYRNEIVDINQRKDEILNELQSSKLLFPKMARPTEKINFTYKLDDEIENDNLQSNSFHRINNYSRNNKMLSSSATMSDKEQNIFLENMNSSNMNRNKLNNTRSVSNNKMQKSIMKSNVNPNIKSMSDNFSADTNINTNNSKNFSTKSPINNRNKEEINEEMISVVDQMNRYKEKMNSYQNNKSKKQMEEKQEIITSNPNFSTKHSTEPTSAKYLKTHTILKKEKIEKLPTIHEKENLNDDVVLMQINPAKKELDKGNDLGKMRKGIKVVEVTPQEKNKHDLLEDVVLKLCIEKMMKKDDKGKPGNYINEPSGVKENLFPFDFQEFQVKSIAEGLFIDYIRNLLRGRKPKNPQTKVKENHSSIEFPSMDLLNRFQLENERRDKELANLLNGIFDRFADMANNKNPIIVPPHDNNIDIDDMVNKISDKLKGSMQININLTTAHEKKPENNNLQYNNQQSLFIEGVKREEEDDIKSRTIYSHPFSETRRVNYEEINRDILMPHMINLNDYDMSSSSSYISETKRSQVEVKKEEIRDESISEGQVLHTHTYTDRETSSYVTTPGMKQNSIIAKTGIDFNMLKQFNENLRNQLMTYNESEQTINYPNENNYNADLGENTLDNDDEESTISINVHKHMVNLNNNEGLKTLNLYDSDEYRLFEKQFGKEQRIEEMTQRMNLLESENRENVMRSQGNSNFKFYKPTEVMNTNEINNTNPNLFSFQNVLSNRTNSNKNFSSQMSGSNKQSSSGEGNNMMKFAKISNEDMQDLVKRQASLNDRLRSLSRNANMNNNNTIPENLSEVTTLQNKEEQNTNNNKKVYQTDESSFTNSENL